MGLRNTVLLLFLGAWLLLHCFSWAQNDASGSGGMPVPENTSCTEMSEQECSELPVRCLSCEINASCEYGSSSTASCQPMKDLECLVSLRVLTPFIHRGSFGFSHIM